MAGGRSSATTRRLQTDPHWRDHVLFYEYFHGDNGSRRRRQPPNRLDRRWSPSCSNRPRPDRDTSPRSPKLAPRGRPRSKRSSVRSEDVGRGVRPSWSWKRRWTSPRSATRARLVLRRATAWEFSDGQRPIQPRRPSDPIRSPDARRGPAATTILDRPLVRFGREICGDLAAALRREWLVTNGLGGYASGTVAGVTTRSYHGLLVAALEPPVARTVLVGGLVEWATVGGRRFPLSTPEFGDGTIAPRGYANLQEFRLEGTLPGLDLRAGRRAAGTPGLDGHTARTPPMSLTACPAGAGPDRAGDHAPRHLPRFPRPHLRPRLATGGRIAARRGATIRAFDGAAPFHLLADGARFHPSGEWWWNFHHRDETARGLNDRGDLFAPGASSPRSQPGETLTLVLTTEADADLDGDRDRCRRARRGSGAAAPGRRRARRPGRAATRPRRRPVRRRPPRPRRSVGEARVAALPRSHGIRRGSAVPARR